MKIFTNTKSVVIDIGSIRIECDGKILWLSQIDDGESMQVNEAKMEKLLQDYYDANF